MWTPEIDNRLIELRKKYGQKETAKRLSHEFGVQITRHMVRHREEKLQLKLEEVAKDPDYKITTEILADGSHRSDKLLRMNEQQSKDVNYLLDAHGYDCNAWELVSAKNNIWNSYSKQDGIMTLYSSKITVKPKQDTWNYEQLLKKIESIPPVVIHNNAPTPLTETKYIQIPLFDMHFGISSFEYYKQTHSKLLHKLNKRFSEVLFIIGQDLFHNDDFRGRTASGREIEKVDMVKAWNDAFAFYESLIALALENSDKVKIMYSKGNHCESMSWAFVQQLKTRFPQAEVNDSFKERKVHMLGNNFIGVNHGDKKKEENLTENFATEFPFEWSRATTRQVHTGHRHSERVVDKGGVVIRRLPTGNDIDQWHDDHGYTTAHKRFEIFEYSEDAVEAIYYV